MGKKIEARENIHLYPESIFLDGSPWKGRWHQAFGRMAPLHLDIGMGFGRFLIQTALQKPEENFLGIERHPHRVLDAYQAAQAQGIDNVLFLCGEVALHLSAAFDEGEIDNISLLFPDPWPEGKKIKHRLTFPPLVERYHHLLKPGGSLTFRSDHPRMAEYSKTVFLRQGFEILQISEEGFSRRIHTDFELRYLAEGKTIHAFDARKEKN
jgi:tRNA (guanine-N7-)-methyltransferase